MSQAQVLLLDEHQLDWAYALVRASAGVSRSCWRAFASDALAQGGGVIGVQFDAQCLYGIAAFRPLATLRYGCALHVELFVAIDLSSAAPVREALCTELVRVARDRGCESLIVAMTGADGPTRSRLRLEWEDAGFRAETVEFVRRVTPSADQMATASA